MELHEAAFVVAAEHASKLVLEWHDGAVKDAVRAGNQVTGNHGVTAVAPHDVVATFRSIFPRDVG
jgi:hypothetical protein